MAASHTAYAELTPSPYFRIAVTNTKRNESTYTATTTVDVNNYTPTLACLSEALLIRDLPRWSWLLKRMTDRNLRHIAHGSIRHDLTAAYFWAKVRRSRSVQLIPFGGVRIGLKSEEEEEEGGSVSGVERPTEERGDDGKRHQRHYHANDGSYHRRMLIHLRSRFDIDLQRRCGCAETGGRAAGPRSRARNITSGNRPLVQ